MILKKNFNIILFINLIFAFLPISFILGNLIININIILFCCVGIFHLKSKIFEDNFNFAMRIFFIFFLLIFFSTAWSFFQSLYYDGYEYKNLSKLIKSFIFFRFFLFLLIVYILSELYILNYKYFFISAAFFSFLISLDVIYQKIFGFNIIGIKLPESCYHNSCTPAYHNSSFFGDELIAGGYIQNFAFFSILFLFLILKNKSKVWLILIPLLIFILATGILFSGNRMPLYLFFLGLGFLFLFNHKFKKILSLTAIAGLIVLFFAEPVHDRIKNSYLRSFYYFHNIHAVVNEIILTSNKKNIASFTPDEKLSLKQRNKDSKLISHDPSHWGHAKLFATAIDTWKKNKIFGNGMKSFRKDCQQITEKIEYRMCSNHPHNYYFEILTETGIIGFVIIIIIAIRSIIFIFKNYKSLKGINIENLFFLATIISLILEVFPIKSTGSVFTTYNATYLILLLSIVLTHKNLLTSKSFK